MARKRPNKRKSSAVRRKRATKRPIKRKSSVVRRVGATKQARRRSFNEGGRTTLAELRHQYRNLRFARGRGRFSHLYYVQYSRDSNDREWAHSIEELGQLAYNNARPKHKYHPVTGETISTTPAKWGSLAEYAQYVQSTTTTRNNPSRRVLKIVLARVDTDFEVVREGRRDLGERPEMREVPKPVALMWLNKGTEADVEKARKYAASEGYDVFVYAATERDPLGRAKKDVLRVKR